MKPIVAVLVLYRMSLEESPTYRTLRSAIEEYPEISRSIQLFIADNSPEPHAPPPDFEGQYLHDGENPGLARRYNQALDLATLVGSTWLLTLDQDTTLTLAYLQELLYLCTHYAADPKIVAFVPKLVTLGKIYSPHPPVYRTSKYSVELSSTGVLGDSLTAFNSASLIRVSALKAVGGYSTDYWLDYLDHATFADLQKDGGKVYVMNAVLEHELSEADPRHIVPARTENVLLAQERFYFQYGTRAERFWRKVDLLRQFIGHGRRGRFAEARRRLRFFLRTR